MKLVKSSLCITILVATIHLITDRTAVMIWFKGEASYNFYAAHHMHNQNKPAYASLSPISLIVHYAAHNITGIKARNNIKQDYKIN